MTKITYNVTYMNFRVYSSSVECAAKSIDVPIVSLNSFIIIQTQRNSGYMRRYYLQ